MKLNVINALRQPGKIFYVQKDMDITDAGGYEAISPLHVSMQYVCSENKINVLGSAVMEIKGYCDRCLKETSAKIAFDFNENFYKPEDLPEDDAYTLDRNFIDLEEPMNSLLEMHAPMKFLCSEDCKGLCKICGHNLNEGDCEHVKKD